MNTLSRLLFNLLLVSASAALHAAEIPASPSPFVMDALCARDGSLWIATEGKGLWMLPPGGAAWQQMTACDSALPTQNYYALAQDAAGRIWAGSDNRGLGIWNGKVWKAYSRMEGMPGERVFSIAVSGNAVAAATNGGVALYREGEAGPWQFFNRAEGMADDACASLCFGEKGVLWAAYSCGGAGYLPAGAAEWKNISAPWDFGGGARQPYEPEGKGLPGNLGNAILAAPGGSVFYACTCGLATAKRGGKDWSFLRGADSKAKNEGLYKPQIPAGQEEAAKKPGTLLEDYVTALYLDGDSLWLGFREKGVQRLRLRDMAPVEDKDAESFNADKDARHRWVRKFVRLSDGSLYAATNGGGLRLVTATTSAPKEKGKKKKEKNPAAVAADFPVLPPADEKAVAAMAARLKPAREVKSGSKKQPPAAPFFWKDDWLTRGNWPSVYGRMYAMLCAVESPKNIVIECDARKGRYKVEGAIGPHHKKDYLRHWLHRHNWPGNTNVLWNPDAGTRTEAEWDDHGEEYPHTWDGPDVWACATVPEGWHMLSLYFYNPNGHENRNGWRDFHIELRRAAEPFRGEVPESTRTSPVLARTRVYDFAGSGCWKHFVVQGPAHYAVRVGGNNSFNTILNGVFLSAMQESKGDYSPQPNWAFPFIWVRDRKKVLHPYLRMSSKITPSLLKCWSAHLHPELFDMPAVGLSRRSGAIACAFPGSASDYMASEIRNTWEQIYLDWTPQEAQKYEEAVLHEWSYIQSLYPYARSSEWRPYSPGVVPLSLKELQYAEAHDIPWEAYRKDSKEKPAITLDELKKRAATKQ